MHAYTWIRLLVLVYIFLTSIGWSSKVCFVEKKLLVFFYILLLHFGIHVIFFNLELSARVLSLSYLLDKRSLIWSYFDSCYSSKTESQCTTHCSKLNATPKTKNTSWQTYIQYQISIFSHTHLRVLRWVTIKILFHRVVIKNCTFVLNPPVM